MSNSPEKLSTYIKRILDVNKDGQITVKDFFALFPNNAIAIIVLVVDLFVVVAEYRVWDVGINITHDTFKALGFVLISAVPFYIGELLWLYPHATFAQKAIAVGFVVGGLYASAQFGMADLKTVYDVPAIVATVIQMSVAYIVAGLVYILIDPNIKAWRARVTSQAALDMEKQHQQMTREMIGEWQKTAKMQQETIDLYGDADAVIAQLQALRGGSPKQMQSFASDSSKVNPTSRQDRQS